MPLTSTQFYRIKARHNLIFAMLVDINVRRGASLLKAFHIARDQEKGIK